MLYKYWLNNCKPANFCHRETRGNQAEAAFNLQIPKKESNSEESSLLMIQKRKEEIPWLINPPLKSSILGPLPFNIYINSLFFILGETNVCNCVDDTGLHACDRKNDIRYLEQLNGLKPTI